MHRGQPTEGGERNLLHPNTSFPKELKFFPIAIHDHIVNALGCAISNDEQTPTYGAHFPLPPPLPPRYMYPISGTLLGYSVLAFCHSQPHNIAEQTAEYLDRCYLCIFLGCWYLAFKASMWHWVPGEEGRSVQGKWQWRRKDACR